MVYVPPVHPTNPRNSASMAGSDAVLAALGKHNTPWWRFWGCQGKPLSISIVAKKKINHAEYNI